jgi:hypothetical protein
MIHARQHGKAGALTVRQALDAKIDFQSGNMWAIGCRVDSMGIAPASVRDAYATAGKIVYTVMSWATPIAWVTSDGTVTVPEVAYSPTTARHQNLCRSSLPAPATISA